jgi:hypothetical protein
MHPAVVCPVNAALMGCSAKIFYCEHMKHLTILAAALFFVAPAFAQIPGNNDCNTPLELGLAPLAAAMCTRM